MTPEPHELAIGDRVVILPGYMDGEAAADHEYPAHCQARILRLSHVTGDAEVAILAGGEYCVSVRRLRWLP